MRTLTLITVVLTALFSSTSLHAAKSGSIIAWGSNDKGQCNVPSPNTGFVAVAAGCYYSFGLKADGSIVAWGKNDYGLCDVPSPNASFVAVAAGSFHSLGLKADGSIVAWGDNADGQCNVPSPNTGFVSVSAGGYHSLGLKADGSIAAWGDNYDGACNVPSPNTGFVSVSAGGYHSLGLKADGSIVAWGYNYGGACNVPLPNTGFVAVAAGGSPLSAHSLGIKAGKPFFSKIDIDKVNHGNLAEYEYMMTIAPPEVRPIVENMIDAVKSGEHSYYKCDVWIEECDDRIDSAVLTTPTGKTYTFTKDQNNPGHFDAEAVDKLYYSFDDLLTDYPFGQYTLTVEFADKTTVSLNANLPSYTPDSFSDYVDGSITAQSSGQIKLNWSTVSGPDKYEVIATSISDNNVVYDSGNLDLVHPTTTETILSGTNVKAFDYIVGVLADKDIVTGQFGIELNSHKDWFVFKNPSLPGTVPANQLPDSNLITPRNPTSDQLFVLTNGGLIYPSKPTIVLTHGWTLGGVILGQTEEQRKYMRPLAQKLMNELGSGVNILLWEWLDNSDKQFPAAASAVYCEGNALATVLVQSLGRDYNQPIHFIGHSLGARVNKQAVETVHLNGFDWRKTHVTIFDAPEIGDMDELPWEKSIPAKAAWIDNYISAVGDLHPEAANVILRNRMPVTLDPEIFDMPGIILGLLDFHGDPINWYENSVGDSSYQMGQHWSFEGGGLNGSPSPGTVYAQKVDLSEPLLKDLELISYSDGEFILATRNALYGLHIVQLALASPVAAIKELGNVSVNYVRDQAEGMITQWTFELILEEGSPAYS